MTRDGRNEYERRLVADLLGVQGVKIFWDLIHIIKY